MPGMNPYRHVDPPSSDVAQPMSADPASTTRPVWKTLTIVLPAVAVSGSTSVLCWLEELWNGSALTRTSVGAADAGGADAPSATHMKRGTNIRRMRAVYATRSEEHTS